ncbi:hypothetical protein SEPCBS57363_005990 [Sporothrix epigloea]|uniref:Uncharacterized protein n=1 Tax=Sporothrix epigloea TaxID=1892477 RepID=A0ABP0E0L2_9PEZI
MSALLRGLPPPAAMTLAHQAPPPAPSQALPSPQHQPQHHHPPQLHQQPQEHAQSYDTSQLPPPPPWQPNGGDDIMRAWLLAKAETEKRRAEEERTHQETIRLEQRRTEHDILRTSLAGGIPPPMVPVVFAGMAGGSLSQAALEWAQQLMFPHGSHTLPQYTPPPHHEQQSQQAQQQYSQHSQLLLQGPGATLNQSESTRPDAPPQQHQLSQGLPPRLPQQHQQHQQHQPSYGQGPYGPGAREGVGPVYGPYQPGSFLPTDSPSPSRRREFTLPGQAGRLDRGGQPPPSGVSVSHLNLPALSTGLGQQQPELQASPPILFHHWQPPGVGGSGGRGSSGGGGAGGEDGGGGGGGGGSGGSTSQAPEVLAEVVTEAEVEEEITR